jgi:hypothetical protein
LEKWAHWWNISVVTAAALLLIGFFWRTELALTDGQLGAPLDDAWIHYQFARNLSQGNGFSFNPGEATPGSTAPLWTLLLAGVGLFTQDFLVPSLFLSAAFFLLTVGLVYGFTYSLTSSRFTALLAALGVAVTGRLLWAGLAGMETTAFAALSLAAVWAYTKWGLRLFPALLFGLAGQMRPEGHALFALAAVDALCQGVVVEHKSAVVVGRQLVGAAIIYGVVAAPYAIFSLLTTGHPLPNTFYAKVGSAHFFSWRTLRETARLHWLDNPVSLVLLPLGLIPLWRRGRLTVIWLLGLPLFTAFIVDFVWHHGRYTMPLIPFQMVAAAGGLNWLLIKVKTKNWLVRSRPLPISGFMLLVFVAGGLWRAPCWARMLGNNAREILEIDVALGHWLAENTPPDALIAVDDIGAITYLSQRRIVDMNGLVSPEMWPALRQPVGLPRNQAAARILSDLAPEFMVGFPLWHWEIATNTAVSEPIHRVQTETHTIIAEQEAVVYRVIWPYVVQALPQIAHETRLGESIMFMGYDLAVAERPLPLTLYWRSLALVTVQYDVFIHILDDAGEIVTQVDRQPVRGLAATHLWQPGDIIRDRYHLDMPPYLPAGVYSIRVGMYLRETAERLPVHGDEPIDNALLLATFIQIP